MNFITNHKRHFLWPLSQGIILECSFDQNHFEDILYERYNIQKPSNFLECTVKRKAEFLAGRYCASLAVKKKLGVYYQILSGTNKEPLWPRSIIGSISHSSNKAIAAIGLQEDYSYIGLDYEPIMSSETFINTLAYIVCPGEMHKLSDSLNNHLELLTLIFSAKESLYKALYPHIQCYFDFQDAQLIELDILKGHFKIELVTTIHERYSSGMQFNGLFSFIDHHVLTMIVQEKIKK